MKYSIYLIICLISTISFSCNRKIQEIDKTQIILSPEDNIQYYLDRLRPYQELVLSPGEYLIDEPLLLTNKMNFVMRGENDVTLKMKTGVPKKNGGMMIVRDCKGFRLSNFDMDANVEKRKIVKNQVPSHNLRLLGVADFEVDSINFVSSMQDGITIQQTNVFPSQGNITHCTFNNYWRSGISIINGRNINVQHCKFGKGLETVIGGGVNVEENDWNKIANIDIEISNCEFGKNLYGVQLSSKGLGSNGVAISKCYFSDNVISVYNSFANTKIDSCVFENNVSQLNKSNVIRNSCHIDSDVVELTVTNSSFVNNSCPTIIYSDGNTERLLIDNCDFKLNSGYTVSFYGQLLEIKNSNFNISDRDVISSFNSAADVSILNNTWSNVSRRVMYIRDASSLVLQNNLFDEIGNGSFKLIKLVRVDKLELRKSSDLMNPRSLDITNRILIKD